MQTLLQGLLEGTESPYLDDLVCLIEPPVFADIAEAPRAFLWAARGRETRQTAPRPLGYQKFIWQVEIALTHVMDPDDTHLDQAFPSLIDSVTGLLNTTVMPLVTTDPATGNETQILTIGETMEVDYASVRTTLATGAGLIKFGANMTCEVQEKVSFPSGVYTP